MRPQQIARAEGMFWGKPVTNTYFRDAEADIERDWKNIILPVIGTLSYDVVVDIAAGHGRNAVKLAENAKQVICVDINPDNVEHMRRRFRDDPKFSVILNDGATLPGIEDGSVDLAYSFDSMVHFDMEIVTAYLQECMRVLRSGGYAFIHCSNYSSNPGEDFRQNPHWRNFMSADLFTHLARRAGFSLVSIDIIPWGDVPGLDCVALLRRPMP